MLAKQAFFIFKGLFYGKLCFMLSQDSGFKSPYDRLLEKAVPLIQNKMKDAKQDWLDLKKHVRDSLDFKKLIFNSGSRLSELFYAIKDGSSGKLMDSRKVKLAMVFSSINGMRNSVTWHHSGVMLDYYISKLLPQILQDPIIVNGNKQEAKARLDRYRSISIDMSFQDVSTWAEFLETADEPTRKRALETYFNFYYRLRKEDESDHEVAKFVSTAIFPLILKQSPDISDDDLYGLLLKYREIGLKVKVQSRYGFSEKLQVNLKYFLKYPRLLGIFIPDIFEYVNEQISYSFHSDGIDFLFKQISFQDDISVESFKDNLSLGKDFGYDVKELAKVLALNPQVRISSFQDLRNILSHMKSENVHGDKLELLGIFFKKQNVENLDFPIFKHALEEVNRILLVMGDRFKNSQSQDIKNLANFLARYFYENELDPNDFDMVKLERVFANRGLPYICKQMRVFSFLQRNFMPSYARAVSKELSSRTHSGKQISHIAILDLLKVSILNGEQSMVNFLELLEKCRPVFSKLEKGQALDKEDTFLFDKIRRVLIDFDPSVNVDDASKVGFNELKKVFRCREGEGLIEKIERKYLRRIGIRGIGEALDLAKNRKREPVGVGTQGRDRFVPRRGDLIKGVSSSYFGDLVSKGIFAPEYASSSVQASDATPGDTDCIELGGDGFEQISSTVSEGYGDIILIMRNHGQFVRDSVTTRDTYELIDLPLYEGQVGVRSGFAFSEVSCIRIKKDSESYVLPKIKAELLKNNVFVPVYNELGELVFASEDFAKEREVFEEYENVVGKYSKEELADFLDQDKLDVEDALNFLRTNFPESFGMSVGVSEGYSLGEHMGYVMRQFEKYGKKLISENVPMWLVRFIILFHDIGKPLAVKYENDTKFQHEYTLKIVEGMMRKLNFSESEKFFVLKILENDYIGNLLRDGADVEFVARNIRVAAEESGKSLEIFYEVLKAYYVTDASSYTSEAGAIGSLDWLFIFNRETGEVDLEEDKKSQLKDLEKILFT